MYTLALESVQEVNYKQVGSKARHLAEMLQRNIQVPGGFVITSNAVELFLQQNADLLNADQSQIHVRIVDAELPEEIQLEALQAYEDLCARRNQKDIAVAVRSSSVQEDLESASFAGQYETLLNIKGNVALIQSIKEVWASMFTSSVEQYLEHNHLALDQSGMAILVQEMIFADVSGVIFSENPVSQNPDELIMNASYGLGEAIVSGLVTPDTFYVNKNTLALQKELGCKEMRIVAGPQGTVEEETLVEEQEMFCLSDEHIVELASETKKIESFYGNALDIEFAVVENDIYILQVRPITA